MGMMRRRVGRDVQGEIMGLHGRCGGELASRLREAAMLE